MLLVNNSKIEGSFTFNDQPGFNRGHFTFLIIEPNIYYIAVC